MTGKGPLAVLSHGIGVRRQDYRFLASMLAQAGYRVASADLRGHGESSMGWASITRTDVAGDLAALTGHLGGPGVLVGHSISGGAATIAAAARPDLVAGIVEINPFTRTARYSLGALLRVRRYRRCVFLLGGTRVFRNRGLFMRYLNLAYLAKPREALPWFASQGIATLDHGIESTERGPQWNQQNQPGSRTNDRVTLPREATCRTRSSRFPSSGKSL